MLRIFCRRDVHANFAKIVFDLFRPRKQPSGKDVAMRERDEIKIRTIIRDHVRRPTQLAIVALGKAGPPDIEYLP
jgi:hypothetical protein